MTAKKKSNARLPSETQRLRSLVADQLSRISGLDAHLGSANVLIETLRGVLREAEYDRRHMDATIKSLARQLGELEAYRTDRQRMDAREGDRAMAATDGSADRVGDAA